MPELAVTVDGHTQRVTFAAGRTLRRILEDADMGIRSGCLGNGACGLCAVRILSGSVSPVTAAEELHLEQGQLASGIRLACQTRPLDDVVIENLSPVPQSGWRQLDTAAPPAWDEWGGWDGVDPMKLPAGVPHPLGAAVDFGTTHIRLSILDLHKGRRLTGRFGLNPQVGHGSDVLTRLQAAAASEQTARQLQELGLGAIRQALEDIAMRDGLDQQQVVRLVIVGNTAMLSLLWGQGQEHLLKPDSWNTPLLSLPDGPLPWAGVLGVHPGAEVRLAPPLSGLVGSDVSAGILATGLLKNTGPSLFMDCGTNSELVLWDGSQLQVTAAAGGPAFEGSGASCSMPAEPGAIHSVCWEGDEPVYSTIPGKTARGLCGSGLVDLVAGLLDKGKLNELGRFATDVPAGGYPLNLHGQELRLRKSDVDMTQQAKAAVAAGMQALLQHAATDWQDLERIQVGGAFGRFLHVPAAQRIGLLPQAPEDKVELCGDTALAGCELAVLYPGVLRLLQELQARCRHLDLARHPDFEDLLMEHLYLRPVSCAQTT